MCNTFTTTAPTNANFINWAKHFFSVILYSTCNTNTLIYLRAGGSMISVWGKCWWTDETQGLFRALRPEFEYQQPPWKWCSGGMFILSVIIRSLGWLLSPHCYFNWLFWCLLTWYPTEHCSALLLVFAGIKEDNHCLLSVGHLFIFQP